MGAAQAYTIELCTGIIEKLLDEPTKKHDWNQHEIEIICEATRRNDLRKWFEKRQVFSNYLKQEKLDEYQPKMIEWENKNPKPTMAQQNNIEENQDSTQQTNGDADAK
jgi:hypothetical protein